MRAHDVFDALVARERLGNTSIGNGVAIPHAQIEQTEQIIGCFMLLKESIDYNADDHQRVNMLLALILPSTEHEAHLLLLDSLSQLFHDERLRQNLQYATSSLELYERLINA